MIVNDKTIAAKERLRASTRAAKDYLIKAMMCIDDAKHSENEWAIEAQMTDSSVHQEREAILSTAQYRLSKSAIGIEDIEWSVTNAFNRIGFYYSHQE